MANCHDFVLSLYDLWYHSKHLFTEPLTFSGCSTDVEMTPAVRFTWEGAIIEVLKHADNNELGIKKLRKKVCRCNKLWPWPFLFVFDNWGHSTSISFCGIQTHIAAILG